MSRETMSNLSSVVAKAQVGPGRIPRWDPQNEKFPMTAPVTARSNRSWSMFLPRGPLDQGATSECVIYSADHFMKTLPIVNRGFHSAEERTRVYKQVQKLDVWAGEDYDGTSVLAMLKWLRANGYITEYRWARDVDTILRHVLEVGPVLMGTVWTWDMFTPDRWGYIRPEGGEAGGHAWLIPCVNTKRKDPLTGKIGAVRKLGSWGSGWGEKGRAWVNLDDLDYLLRSDGEAAAAIEIKKVI
jgi:hypothetical protein